MEGKVFGAKVRSRALFLAQEERLSKYFLRLESFKGRSKCITELRDRMAQCPGGGTPSWTRVGIFIKVFLLQNLFPGTLRSFLF